VRPARATDLAACNALCQRGSRTPPRRRTRRCDHGGNGPRRRAPRQDHGLRLVHQLTLMTIGLYNEPDGAYLPSVLY